MRYSDLLPENPIVKANEPFTIFPVNKFSVATFNNHAKKYFNNEIKLERVCLRTTELKVYIDHGSTLEQKLAFYQYVRQFEIPEPKKRKANKAPAKKINAEQIDPQPKATPQIQTTRQTPAEDLLDRELEEALASSSDESNKHYFSEFFLKDLNIVNNQITVTIKENLRLLLSLRKGLTNQKKKNIELKNVKIRLNAAEGSINVTIPSIPDFYTNTFLPALENQSFTLIKNQDSNETNYSFDELFSQIAPLENCARVVNCSNEHEIRILDGWIRGKRNKAINNNHPFQHIKLSKNTETLTYTITMPEKININSIEYDADKFFKEVFIPYLSGELKRNQTRLGKYFENATRLSEGQINLKLPPNEHRAVLDDLNKRIKTLIEVERLKETDVIIVDDPDNQSLLLTFPYEKFYEKVFLPMVVDKYSYYKEKKEATVIEGLPKKLFHDYTVLVPRKEEDLVGDNFDDLCFKYPAPYYFVQVLNRRIKDNSKLKFAIKCYEGDNCFYLTILHGSSNTEKIDFYNNIFRDQIIPKHKRKDFDFSKWIPVNTKITNGLHIISFPDPETRDDVGKSLLKKIRSKLPPDSGVSLTPIDEASLMIKFSGRDDSECQEFFKNQFAPKILYNKLATRVDLHYELFREYDILPDMTFFVSVEDWYREKGLINENNLYLANVMRSGLNNCVINHGLQITDIGAKNGVITFKVNAENQKDYFEKECLPLIEMIGKNKKHKKTSTVEIEELKENNNNNTGESQDNSTPNKFQKTDQQIQANLKTFPSKEISLHNNDNDFILDDDLDYNLGMH